MTYKKKTVALMIATLVSMTTILSPVTSIYAIENDTPTTSEPIKQTAPNLVLPEGLEAIEEQSLQEISLPQGWTWKDDTLLVSKEIPTYLAKYLVDDTTYDYTQVEGYNEIEHCIEKEVSISIQEESMATLQEQPITTSESLMPRAIDDVAINETNFPDTAFRNTVKIQGDKDNNNSLTPTEIAAITSLTLSPSTESINGVEFLTSLTRLNCNSAKITELDISSNTLLTSLDCSNTKINELDVSNNTQLTDLACSNTPIRSLDTSNIATLEYLICDESEIENLNISNNNLLANLSCNNTKITNLDLPASTSLFTVKCSNTGLTSLDVSKNTGLLFLEVANTEITSMDFSQNTKLFYFNCNNTPITNLDFNQNTDLYKLDCINSKITNLDLSKNKKLNALDCSGSNLSSLDVSANTALKTLNVSDTNLSWLTIGNNRSLELIKNSGAYDCDVTVTGPQFNLSELYPEIGLIHIAVQGGGNIDTTTGVVSGYTVGTPITYTYNCGTSNDGHQKITVNLNLHLSTPSITIDTLDKVYDGQSIDYSKMNMGGSTGAISYVWKKQMGSDWSEITEAPTEAGVYQVTVQLAATDYYASATATKEFTISKTNATISINKDLNKTYDGRATSLTNNDITTNSTGNITYTWEKYDSTNWIASDIPVNVGKYRVTAYITEDTNHTAVTSLTKEFIISKSDTTISINKDLNKTYDGEKISLSDGDITTQSTGSIHYIWEVYDSANWVESDTPINVGKYRITASVTEDSNYNAASSTVEFEIKKVNDPIIDIKPKDPTINGDTASNTEDNTASNTVKTGFNDQVSLFAMLGIVSLGIMACITSKKRKIINK